jgi:hypothetical protein
MILLNVEGDQSDFGLADLKAHFSESALSVEQPRRAST